jgi:hypothetical protein
MVRKCTMSGTVQECQRFNTYATLLFAAYCPAAPLRLREWVGFVLV